MKSKVLVPIIIALLVGLSLGAKEILKKRNYDYPPPIYMPQLSEAEIAGIINRESLNQFMIGFSILGSPYQVYEGHVFNDLTLIFRESVSSTEAKDQLANQRAKGEKILIEPSIVRRIDETPYGQYTNCYKLELPKDILNQLISVLLKAKRQMPDDPPKEPSMMGILFSLGLFMDEKAAVYGGEAYTDNPEYDQNEELLRFELDTLIPYIKQNGTIIEYKEFRSILLDNLEGYSFAQVWEEE